MHRQQRNDAWHCIIILCMHHIYLVECNLQLMITTKAQWPNSYLGVDVLCVLTTIMVIPPLASHMHVYTINANNFLWTYTIVILLLCTSRGIKLFPDKRSRSPSKIPTIKFCHCIWLTNKLVSWPSPLKRTWKLRGGWVTRLASIHHKN